MEVKKRPCRICRKWFMPHPRAGDRQKVCHRASCQAERKRRSQRAWRERNPNYDQKRRLQQRLLVEAKEECPNPAPVDQVNWEVVEKVTGPAHRVVTESLGRLITAWCQNLVAPKAQVQSEDLDRLPAVATQNSVIPKEQVSTGQSDRLPSMSAQNSVGQGPQIVRTTVPPDVGAPNAARDPPA